MSLSSIIAVAAHQQITISPGLSFIPYHAGHVLGACMFMIDIAGLKILYTGDYSREEDRHLVPAEVPPVHPDVLIVESTFGVQGHEGREDKEHRFTSLVHNIVRRGGHVLMPVFALGRAQELLLILEEYWKKHPDLHSVPVYYASNLARKCMAIYQSNIHMMNESIKARFHRRDNPFVFKCVTLLFAINGLLRTISDTYRTSNKYEDGRRKSPKVRHASYWLVQPCFKLDRAESCWKRGLPMREMGSS